MPTPVIEASDMPAVFKPVVEQEYLAQKIASVPEIVFISTGMKDDGHFSIPEIINYA